MEKLVTTRNRTRNTVTKLLEKLDELRNSTDFKREEAIHTLKFLRQLEERLNVLNEEIVDALAIEDIEDQIVAASE